MSGYILSKPTNGWTYFCLEGHNHRLSYMTYVPLDWLNAAIYGLENLTPFALEGFSEPRRFLCLVSYWNCHIIVENDEKFPLLESELERSFIHITMLDFCKMLYSDIKNNIAEWSDWKARNDNAEKEKTREEILSRLEKLEELIKKREAHFKDNCCFL